MMVRVRSVVLMAGVIVILFANGALADWFNEYDDQVALSEDESVSFTCPPPGVDFIGPTFSFYFDQDVPALDEPTLAFTFDQGERFEWDADYGADLYVGPVEHPYANGSSNGKIASLGFGTHRAAIGSWVALAEDFMEHDSVIISVNGVDFGPISLNGSSKALHHIAYLLPPC
ncbi:MAG: hypothetical protein IE937_12590 [Gammaproteobacteria bacterium]|nr:hypothetical protein [Gammaproteobacteria bacterium]